MKEINNDVMEYLKDTTKLGFAGRRKYNEARRNMLADAQMLEEKEGYFPGVDFHKLALLEYQILFDRVKSEARELYAKLGQGLSEDEFTTQVIRSDMEARKENRPKVRKRSKLRLFNPMDYNIYD